MTVTSGIVQSLIRRRWKNGERVWLNFEGVNRKGEIFFNGTRLGLLDGFMHRGEFR